jgi:hypothetical protein
MTPRDLVQQALTHHRAGDLPRAEQLYRQALSLDPNYADAHHFLGTLAHQQGQDDVAIQLLSRAFQLKPSPRTLNNLGEAYRSLDRDTEALRCFSTAATMVPTYAEAHQNLGVVLAQQLKLDAALAAYAKAIQLQPDNAEAHVNRALVWLQQGDYSRGFQEYEWRHQRLDYARPFSQPRWTGSPLGGKTLLIWSEQGFGDTLQFARFLPHAMKLAGNDGRILFECQRELIPLFHDLPRAEVIPQGDPLPPFDAQCALMSLPLVLRTTLKSLPREIPYLSPPPDRISRWPARFAQIPQRKIGLAWSTNAASPTARRRSCRLADFAPLASVANTRLFSLQKGPASSETAASAFPITDWTSDLSDFADTAALISQLDLVITVDTAVAHIAGAIGKTFWVLVPFAPDWRWLLNRSDSPWYPTARIFRQHVPGNWTQVISQIAEAQSAYAGV